MAIGVFADKEHRPTGEEILAAVGSSRAWWENLNRFVAENYRTREDFAFYGKNYGWALRFRKGGKALLSMYPGQDSFTVQIILGPTQAEKALSLDIGENARKIIQEAHQFAEGRWVFLRVESEQDLADVEQLLMVKSPPAPQRE